MKQIPIYLLILLTGCIIKNIDVQPDERAVVDDEILMPGIHLVSQNRRVHIYSMKQDIYQENITFVTNDQLQHSAEFIARFHILEDRLIDIRDRFQNDYKMIFVVPETRASIRNVFSSIRSDSLLSITQESVEYKIEEDLKSTLGEFGVNLISFSLNKVIFPAEIQIVKHFHLEEEYKILKTSKDFDKKQRAIDSMLKPNSKELIKIILRVYSDDEDERIKDYILDNIRK